MATATEPHAGIVCSFCLKPTSEVTKMVAGPGVFICDECVALGHARQSAWERFCGEA